MLLFLTLWLWPFSLWAAGEGGFRHPERLAAALTLGHIYDPSPTFGFYQLTGVLQYDYDRLWPHPAPADLFFKVEGNLGLVTYRGDTRLLASANILAQYYLTGFGADRFRPYVEAGIGLVYSDFQVEGQGWRVNFNPQAGIGCDLRSGNGTAWFTAFRLHHLSNGELYHDNRGVNSVLLQVGRYF
jgi:hypothetical protein